MCREGVHRLHSLVCVPGPGTGFNRQVDDLMLFPTDSMISFVYKKFGGELTRVDMEGGMTAEELAAEASRHSEAQQQAWLEQQLALEASSKASKRFKGLKPYVVPENPDYEREAALRETRRNATDWHATARAEISAFFDRRSRVRAKYEAWRAEADRTSYEQAVRPRGPRLDDVDPRPPFQWPFPRAPETFNAHPHKPSGSRIEDLEAPWAEDAARGEVFVRTDANVIADSIRTGRRPFQTRIRADALFGARDPEYWTSVHLGGDGLAAELAALRRREREEWAAKVVVDDLTFRVVGGLAIGEGDPAAQSTLNRLRPMLEDSPRKLSMKILHRKGKFDGPAPVNMMLEVPWSAGDRDTLLRKPNKEKWIADDFKRL